MQHKEKLYQRELYSLIKGRTNRKTFDLEEAVGKGVMKKGLAKYSSGAEVKTMSTVEDTMLNQEKMSSQFNELTILTMKNGNKELGEIAKIAVTQINKNNSIGLIKALKMSSDWDNSYDINMNSLLHYAAYTGHPKMVKLLIEEGLPIVDLNKYGLQPLHIAAFFGHTEIIEILLARGANDLTTVEMQVNDFSIGCIPLYLAILNNKEDTAEYLLGKCLMRDFPVSGLGNIYHLMALRANEAMLDSLLPSNLTQDDINLQFKKDVNLKVNGFTPYTLAIHQENIAAINKFAKILEIDDEVEDDKELPSNIKADFNLYDVTQFGRIHTIEKLDDSSITIETEKELKAIYQGKVIELKQNKVYIDNISIEANDTRLLQFTFKSNETIVRPRQLKYSDPILIAPNKKMFWETSSSTDSSQQEIGKLTYRS